MCGHAATDGPVLGRRRGVAWRRVSHGLHRPASDTSDLPAWQLVLPPTGRFTHLTAAGLLGWWLPPLPEDLPVFVAMSDVESRPQRHGLVVARHRDIGEPCLLEGLRVASAPEVLLACARDLSLLDLVVLVDAALHRGASTVDEVTRTASQRRRGAPLLRRAVALADRRAESPWESMLRMLHVACQVAVQPQFELRDEHGAPVARADLRVQGTNALHEYDGAHHLASRQQREDLGRVRRIGNETWVRRGYTSADVLHQAVGILRDADLSLGREHRPERVRPWHRLLADSTFTPSGRERLRRRLRLPATATGGERRRRTA